MPVTPSSAADTSLYVGMAPHPHTDGISTTQEDRRHEHNLPKQAELARTDRGLELTTQLYPQPRLIEGTSMEHWHLTSKIHLYLHGQSNSRSAQDPQQLQLCVRGRATQPCTSPSALWQGSRDMLCHFCHSQPTSLPWPPVHPEHPPGYPALLCESHWAMCSGGDVRGDTRSHKNNKVVAFNGWIPGLHRDHHSRAWAETLLLLNFLNHPVCNLTTIIFLSASGYTFLVTT